MRLPFWNCYKPTLLQKLGSTHRWRYSTLNSSATLASFINEHPIKIFCLFAIAFRKPKQGIAPHSVNLFNCLMTKVLANPFVNPFYYFHSHFFPPFGNKSSMYAQRIKLKILHQSHHKSIYKSLRHSIL